MRTTMGTTKNTKLEINEKVSPRGCSSCVHFKSRIGCKECRRSQAEREYPSGNKK